MDMASKEAIWRPDPRYSSETLSAPIPPIVRSAGFRAALAHRGFRRLWIGQAMSAIGDQAYVVALAVLVIQSGGGASQLGLAMAGRAGSMVLFLLVGGVVADRLRRTHAMIAADAVRGLSVLAVAALGTDAPLAALIGLSLVIGAGEAFFRPAYGAVLPQLLPSEALATGNALGSVTTRAALLLGPALAGGLIATVGVRGALLLDAATFAVSLVTLATLRGIEPVRARDPGCSALRDARDGLDAVRARPWLALVIAVCSVHLLFAIAPWLVLLPVVAEQSLGGTDTYTALLVVFGAGALVGALAIGRWRPRRPGVIALAGLVTSGLMLFALAGPASIGVVAASVFLCGLGEQVFDVLWVTAVQRDVPNGLLGRVVSLDFTFSLALQPLGFALAGPAADLVGTSELLTFGGCVVVLSTLPLLLMPSVRALASPRQPVVAGAGG
jgi:MFS family permease